MSKTPLNITAAELKILKVLWRIRSGTVRDVLDALSEDVDAPPAYTTVMTMMNQLAGKGGLHTDRARQPFVYKPAVRRDRVMAHRVKQFVQQVFDGQAGELLLQLVEQADLSPEDVKRIEAKIEARDAEEPAKPKRRKSRKKGT